MKETLVFVVCLALLLCTIQCEIEEVKECDASDLATCSVAGTDCDGNTINIECTSGKKCKMKCTDVCDMEEQSYTGTCSSSYQGQPSSTGDDVCWCTGECMPDECGEDSCGTMEDGCGGTLECGGCAPPETCGGSGVPNLCGEPSVDCAEADLDYGFCWLEYGPGANCYPACYWDMDRCFWDCGETDISCQCDCVLAEESCRYECNDVMDTCLEERGVADCPAGSIPQGREGENCEAWPDCCGDTLLGEYNDCIVYNYVRGNDTIGCY